MLLRHYGSPGRVHRFDWDVSLALRNVACCPGSSLATSGGAADRGTGGFIPWHKGLLQGNSDMVVLESFGRYTVTATHTS